MMRERFGFKRWPAHLWDVDRVRGLNVKNTRTGRAPPDETVTFVAG